MIPIIRLKEILKIQSFKDFGKFMEGQTYQMDKDGRSMIYEDDFLRWVKKQKVID